MTPTLEHIKQEIKALPSAERFNLWRDLAREFDPPMAEGDDEESVETVWDAESSASRSRGLPRAPGVGVVSP